MTIKNDHFAEKSLLFKTLKKEAFTTTTIKL